MDDPCRCARRAAANFGAEEPRRAATMDTGVGPPRRTSQTCGRAAAGSPSSIGTRRSGTGYTPKTHAPSLRRGLGACRNRSPRMRSRGVEPPRVLPHQNLNLARLPVPPHPRAGALGAPPTIAASTPNSSAARQLTPAPDTRPGFGAAAWVGNRPESRSAASAPRTARVRRGWAGHGDGAGIRGFHSGFPLMSGGAAADIIQAACPPIAETTRRGGAYRLLSRIVRGGVQPPPARRRRLFAGPDMLTEGSLPLNDEDD